MHVKNRIRKWEENNAWYKFYNNMVGRCKADQPYGMRGIKVLVTLEDIKEIWFRDKAYLLDKPSLDRKNGLGNYSKENIQFIEYKENVRKRDLVHPHKWEKHGKCNRCDSNKKRYGAFGLCTTCLSYVYRYDKNKYRLYKNKFGELHHPPIRQQRMESAYPKSAINADRR